jgi:hypothetical protein
MPGSCPSRGRSGDVITAKSLRLIPGDLLGSSGWWAGRSEDEEDDGSMAQQKSEDRVVPDGGVTPAQLGDGVGQGKAVPVDQEAGQLGLPIATAEHRTGVPDRSGTDRVAVEPKAIVNAEQVAPVSMEEVAYRLTARLWWQEEQVGRVVRVAVPRRPNDSGFATLGTRAAPSRSA